MRDAWLRLCAVVLLAGAADAAAQPPAPLDVAGRYAFPGAVPGPASAVSAGLALSDRWLGDEPFDNPAGAPARGVMAAPVFQRVERQDLPAEYSDYAESAGFLDLAGGWLSLPVRGTGVALYASEPVLRLEDEAFASSVGQLSPGVFTSTSRARETRAGLALSRAWRAARFGAALEWTRRDDAYDFTERSGNPFAGARHVDFSGDGVGFQVGARAAVVPRVTMGVALRRLPALELSGKQSLPAPAVAGTLSATRAAGWEGGLSGRVVVTGACRVLASVGVATAQSWDGFDVTTGRAASWAVGLDYDDAATPVVLRVGLGQEQQDGVPEPRAGVLGLGLGLKLDELRFDVGALRRSIARADKATSYDDRVLASATVGF